MALTFDFSEVKDYRTTCLREGADGESYLTQVTNDIVWATLAIGIGTITEKNHVEFWQRLRFMQTVWGTERKTTLAEVREHIGLRTNVSKEPQAAWLKRQFETFAREQLRAEQRRAETQQ